MPSTIKWFKKATHSSPASLIFLLPFCIKLIPPAHVEFPGGKSVTAESSIPKMHLKALTSGSGSISDLRGLYFLRNHWICVLKRLKILLLFTLVENLLLFTLVENLLLALIKCLLLLSGISSIVLEATLGKLY